jgi:hypothetical protein
VGLDDVAPGAVRLRTTDGGDDEDVPATDLPALIAARLKEA